MEIDNIQLKTAHLNDLKAFYADTVECPITPTHADEFTVQIGTTAVTFSKAADGTDPFYHFAIDIPRNQFDDAVTWLADRVELLSDPETGEREFISGDNKYQQVYCLDPADNILELIARHNLSNDSERPFGSENFRNVSEIGLPVPAVKRAVEALNDTVGVSPRDSRVAEIPGDATFAAVGTDPGVFIVVTDGRVWFPTRNQAAEIHPVTIEISDTTNEYVFPNLPYRISPS
jgi:catechol-2,3-dioxygenase